MGSAAGRMLRDDAFSCLLQYKIFRKLRGYFVVGDTSGGVMVADKSGIAARFERQLDKALEDLR